MFTGLTHQPMLSVIRYLGGRRSVLLNQRIPRSLQKYSWEWNVSVVSCISGMRRPSVCWNPHLFFSSVNPLDQRLGSGPLGPRVGINPGSCTSSGRKGKIGITDGDRADESGRVTTLCVLYAGSRFRFQDQAKSGDVIHVFALGWDAAAGLAVSRCVRLEGPPS